MVLKGPRFRVSPMRAYVVVGSPVVAASLAAGTKLVVGAPSSSGLGTNDTFVDTPPRYRYL